jgi:hypothetical protein
MRLRLIPVALGLALLICGPVAEATPMLSFIIDGNTFTQPFSITNVSDGGEQVVGFHLDLAGVGLVYDPVDGGAPGNGTLGTPFAAVGGSDVTTGLTPVVIPDGATILDLAFGHFEAGETFSWDIDVDHGTNMNNVTIYGSEMIGALAYVDFSDGQTLPGVLAAVHGNCDASQFIVTGIVPTDPVPEPGTLLLLGSGLVGFAARRRRRG